MVYRFRTHPCCGGSRENRENVCETTNPETAPVPKRKKSLPPRLPVAGQRFGSIPQACAYTGIGRNSMYELARQHPIMRKFGGRSLIDFQALDSVLDNLPLAYPPVAAE